MHCWARYLFIIFVAVLATGQMIVACGQMGDLYLPESKPASKQVDAGTEDGAVPEVQTGEALEIDEDISGADAIPTDGRE